MFASPFCSLNVYPLPPFYRSPSHLSFEAISLRHHRARRSAFVSPVWRQDADGLVVATEAVDAGFDEDKTELGVFVLAVALKVFADGHSLRQRVRTKHQIPFAGLKREGLTTLRCGKNIPF
jgi:hypothetical protein